MVVITEYKQLKIKFREKDEYFFCDIPDYGEIQDKSLAELKKLIDKALKGEFKRQSVFFGPYHKTPIEGTVTSKVLRGYQAGNHYHITYKTKAGFVHREQVHRDYIFEYTLGNKNRIAEMCEIDKEIEALEKKKQELLANMTPFKEDE